MHNYRVVLFEYQPLFCLHLINESFYRNLLMMQELSNHSLTFVSLHTKMWTKVIRLRLNVTSCIATSFWIYSFMENSLIRESFFNTIQLKHPHKWGSSIWRTRTWPISTLIFKKEFINGRWIRETLLEVKTFIFFNTILQYYCLF